MRHMVSKLCGGHGGGSAHCPPCGRSWPRVGTRESGRRGGRAQQSVRTAIRAFRDLWNHGH